MTMLPSLFLFFCITCASFNCICSYISPLHNRRLVRASKTYIPLKPWLVSTQRTRLGAYSSSDDNSGGFTDDIFDDDLKSKSSTSSTNMVEGLGSSATEDIAEVPEIDIMKAFEENILGNVNGIGGELALLSENSAENPNAGDGVMSASDNDISEISNSIEERIPAYALLYRFEKGFSVDQNPLVEEHEEFCDDFDTLINSELLSLDEDQNGAVILWGSFNSTAEGKSATMQEIRRFQKNDPLNDMLEEFEIIDMSPHIPAAEPVVPEESDMVIDTLHSSVEALRKKKSISDTDAFKNLRNLGDILDDNM